MLALELQRAQRDLADRGVDAEWRAEAELWRKEVGALRNRVEEQQRRHMEAAEEARVSAARAEEAERALAAELRAEEVALREVTRRSAELAREQAHWEAVADEAERRTATLRRSIEQQALLGPAGGGTAHLFVAALPALDVASVEWVRGAVDAQLQQLQVGGQR